MSRHLRDHMLGLDFLNPAELCTFHSAERENRPFPAWLIPQLPEDVVKRHNQYLAQRARAQEQLRKEREAAEKEREDNERKTKNWLAGGWWE